MLESAITKRIHPNGKSPHQSQVNSHLGSFTGKGRATPTISASQAGGFLSAIQPKLAINQPGDIYEQEADHVAEQVMRMPEPMSFVGSSSKLQRKCAACASGQGTCPQCAEEEKMVQRKPLFPQITPLMQRQTTKAPEEEEELLQTKAASGETPSASPSVESHVNGLRGGGQSLPESTRAFFESRLGQDLSHVRVHTNMQAAKSANSVNALAYTVGRDVVFGAGQYSPGTTVGKNLLAHELTHVIQQSTTGAQGNVIQRYEAPEHQDLGDKALGELAEFLKTPAGVKWAEQYKLDPKAVSELPADPFLKGAKIKVGTLELTPGDIIALMGDLYRTPQAMASAPPQEIKELLAVVQRERKGELAGGKANELYQQTTLKYRSKSESYLELAKINAPHFARGNKAEWEKWHRQAITKAREAGDNEAAFQEALLIDAAAGHFLTDVFASGHLFDKSELEVAIISHLQNNPARPQNPEMQAYFGLFEAKNAMYLLVLKNIHDRLNAEGVEATNKKGMKWRTFGDDHLKNAEETRHIAALAVYLSRRQITLARPESSPEPDLNEVLDLLPDEETIKKTTAQAISYIPAAIAQITELTYRQRRLARTEIPLIGRLIEANLETIASPGRQRQLEQIQETARTTGIPQVAPSVTVLSW